jgi:Flp pilus assembly protein TadB
MAAPNLPMNEVVGHEPHNPVRDDSRLAPTEDLDRDPDGVPHSVVGMTAGFAVMFAMLVAFMFLAGSTVTRVAAVVICMVAVPVVVSQLRKKSDRERDHVHPSR